MSHKQKEESAMRLTIQTLKGLFKMAVAYKPAFDLLYFCYIVVNSIMPFINMIFLKYIIDELIGGRDIKKLILYVSLTVGLTAVFEILKSIIESIKNKYKDELDQYFARKISEKAISMDFEQTEAPSALEQMEKAKVGMDWYSGGVCGLADSFSEIMIGIIILLGTTTLLLFKIPWLIVIYVLSLYANKYLTDHINAINTKAFKEMAQQNRVFGYLFWTLQEVRFGKDIRLYGAEQMMESKNSAYNNEMVGTWRRQSNQRVIYEQGQNVVEELNTIMTLLFVGYKALMQMITIGDFSMYFNAGMSFRGSLGRILFNMQFLYQKVCYAKEFLAFMDYPDALVHGKEAVPESESYIVEFKNVSFAYPRSKDFVLKHINMVLHPGEHISIVGLNGAGKTTFIKLLCRLYDPTEGEILLNGVNIKNYDYDEYVKLIGVVFQDFELFAFSARENIMLQDSSRQLNQEEYLTEIIDKAGLTEIVSHLPKGLDTPIKKEYEEGGVELSGGQQQKLAIARALYKDAPIVILDEPTATLDPIAEYEVYHQFNRLIGNKTAIYISHRLSSCQFCDIIYVFEAGRIKEVGTHKNLLKVASGSYATMFEAQAQYYK